MIETMLFLHLVESDISIPQNISVRILYFMVLVFLVSGIIGFIISPKQARSQGSGATSKQPRHWLTIASTGILVLPLLSFLLAGSTFLPSLPFFPTPAPSNGTATPVPTNTNTHTHSPTPSPNGLSLVTPGTLTVGSDTTYPPQDFLDKNNKAIGFDIDLITAMAQNLGLKVVVKSESFPALIPDLTNHKFDIVISAVPINANTTSQADFVPYLNKSIESFMVLKSNAGNYNNLGLGDLCGSGKTVGVLAGSSALDDLNTANSNSGVCLVSPIAITKKTDTASIVNSLLANQIDIAYLDAPVATYYMKLQQNQGKFSVVGSVTESVQEGIAVRQGDDVIKQAMAQALKALQDNKTYKKLLDKWGFTSESL